MEDRRLKLRISHVRQPGILTGSESGRGGLIELQCHSGRHEGDVKHLFMKNSKLIPVCVLIGLISSSCFSDHDWRTASRESAGIAPVPSATNEAVLHVYGAKAWSWRGWFAIHTWIATKRTGEVTLSPRSRHPFGGSILPVGVEYDEATSQEVHGRIQG